MKSRNLRKILVLLALGAAACADSPAPDEVLAAFESAPAITAEPSATMTPPVTDQQTNSADAVSAPVAQPSPTPVSIPTSTSEPEPTVPLEPSPLATPTAAPPPTAAAIIAAPTAIPPRPVVPTPTVVPPTAVPRSLFDPTPRPQVGEVVTSEKASNPCPTYSVADVAADPFGDWDRDKATNQEEFDRNRSPCVVNAFRTCKELEGIGPIVRGDYEYWAYLDKDDDGIACEE